MTPDEWAEYNLVYQTRIGIICDLDEPTFEQIEMAKAEANEAIKNMPKGAETHYPKNFLITLLPRKIETDGLRWRIALLLATTTRLTPARF